MDEKVFFDEGGIKVTSARFIVPSQTFAMSGITSVKRMEEPAGQLVPIFGLLIGAGFLLAGVSHKDWGQGVFGLVMAAGSIAWLGKQKSTHHVFLTTASGELKALTSQSREMISGVVQALNDAIVHRG